MNINIVNSNFNNLTLHQQYTLLLNFFTANRLLIFPPPVVNPNVMLSRLTYVNRRNPRNKSVNGYRMLRYFVSRNIDPTISNLTVSRVTHELWKSATSLERADYINLSNQVKQIMG